MHYSNFIIGDDERTSAVSLTAAMTVVCYVDRFPRSRKPVQFRRIPDSLPPPVVCDQPRASCDLCRRASRNSKWGPAPEVCDLGPPDCSLCRLALRNTNLSKQLDALLSDTDMHRHAEYDIHCFWATISF